MTGALDLVLVGGGEIGFLIAEALHKHHNLTVIETDIERESAFEALDVQFVRGNGADPEDLKAAGVGTCDAFIACTVNDDVNVLACLAAKGLGARETLAFVTRQRYVDAFAKAGAFQTIGLGIDRVLWPQRTLALQIADIVRVPRAVDSAEFAGGSITMLEYRLEADDPFIHVPIQSAKIPSGVLAVGRIHEDVFSIPVGLTVFEPGDKAVFMGTRERMRELQRHFGPRKRSLNVVIVGGGNVGFMVAQQLGGDRTHITIFEVDEDRCDKLAQWLPHALVLRGDGTDLELLQQERIEDADVLVAVTDDDGKNLLVSLLSKHLGIPKVITRVGRARNRRLFERVGIDVPLTPRAAAVQEVLNWLKLNDVEPLASIEDRAEVIEVTFPADRAGGSVREIGSPRGSLIGVIQRGRDVFVPHGDTAILPNDHLFIVTTPDMVEAVDVWLEALRELPA